jgi:hypothetical protein
LKRIDQADRERGFWADYRQVDFVLAREIEKAFQVGRLNIDIFRISGSTGVSRCDENTIRPRTLADLPGQRVFSATVANH